MWRKYKQPDQYELFKNAINIYTFVLNAEKQRSLSQKVIDFHGDSKKLYKFVSELTGKKTENPMPEGESDTAIAEHFANHFLDKINKIRDALASFEKFTPEHKEVPCFGMFEELTQDEVKKIINHLQTKSCELDALPTRVLK